MRNWLISARAEKEFTQEEVAKACNIARNYYGMIERGERSPSVSLAKKIASILDFCWTIFFENKTNETLIDKRETV